MKDNTSKRKRGRGQPTKCTPARLKAILEDLARGFTREEACARNGCSHDAFQRWERRLDYSILRARARAIRKLALLAQVEAAAKRDWKAASWLLEKHFPEEFGSRPAIGLEQHNMTINITPEQSREIDARARRLLEDSDRTSPDVRS